MLPVAPKIAIRPPERCPLGERSRDWIWVPGEVWVVSDKSQYDIALE